MNRSVPTTVALTALLIGGCGEASAPPTPTRAAKATTTQLKPGQRCPVTPLQFVARGLGYAQGDGRVRYIGLPRGRATRITAPYTPDSGVRHSAWGAQKVMFVFRDIDGVIEVRGRRLDAPGDVRFSHGDVPADVWRMGWLDGSHTWQNGVVLVRLKGAGCYALDISAPGVRETIVFRAVIWHD
jgi:hypothetical protein